jgi:dihydroorotate dehydrogenase
MLISKASSAFTKLAHKLPPEISHNLAINFLANGCQKLIPPINTADDNTVVAGLNFKHKVGLAAGFDKNAEAINGLVRLGFSHIEVGTVTPKAQDGNAKPRMFRLNQDQAIINRLGFNNKGHEFVYQNVMKYKTYAQDNNVILGVNVGKNKASDDAIADYTAGVRKFCQLADYITINISSPNTHGLRDLQQKDSLEKLLSCCLQERAKQNSTTPIFLKIAPDNDAQTFEDIVTICNKLEIDGLIATNTTISRPKTLRHSHSHEAGGLSGKPLRELSLNSLQTIKSLQPNFPIIACGGISSKQDALASINSGACLVQIYTAFVYQGLEVVRNINPA